MKGKIGLVVGLGVGYVLGTRAGRERYEPIKKQWLKVWNLDPVQAQRTDQLPIDIDAVAEGIGQVIELVPHHATGRDRYEPLAPIGLVAELVDRIELLVSLDPAIFHPV